MLAQNIKISINQKILSIFALLSVIGALRSPSSMLMVGLSVIFLWYCQVYKIGSVKFAAIRIYFRTICFGIYLLHPSFLILATKLGFGNGFLDACAGFLFSVVASSLLYLLIERPGISPGKRIANKIENRNTIPV
jgi:peptidoglycan/LPS O-acetylase OafA/YrhL